MWEGQLQNGDIPRDLKETETQLRNLNEHITHIQTATFEVTQRGRDLLQVNIDDYLTILSNLSIDLWLFLAESNAFVNIFLLIYSCLKLLA